MELSNETVLSLATASDEGSVASAGSQLTEFELCLVGGGMGDVQQ